jgi:hypothetical protein
MAMDSTSQNEKRERTMKRWKDWFYEISIFGTA